MTVGFYIFLFITCEKEGSIIGFLIGIVAFFIVPFLLYTIANTFFYETWSRFFFECHFAAFIPFLLLFAWRYEDAKNYFMLTPVTAMFILFPLVIEVSIGHIACKIRNKQGIPQKPSSLAEKIWWIISGLFFVFCVGSLFYTPVFIYPYAASLAVVGVFVVLRTVYNMTRIMLYLIKKIN